MPKTGGTTLEEIIARRYEGGETFRFTGSAENEDAFRGLNDRARAGLDLMSGHTHFGVHEYIPSDCTYITMLRHPVDRIVSLYYYVLGEPDHYLHRHGFGDRHNLEDFVLRPITYEIDNLQTRLLNPRPPMYMPAGGVTEAMFERAAVTLEEHFAVVGVTERFDDMLAVLRGVFGWQDLSYERRNVTRDRPRAEDLPGSTIEAIREANRFDERLHALADRLLSASLGRLGMSTQP
jgi:hypothetical protein